MTDNIFKQTNVRLETMSKELGMDIAQELCVLPSNGLLYPPEHAFHHLENVELRPMSAREEDLLSSRALIKKGTVITELIRSCLLNKSVDVDSLLIGDRNAILIAIRVSGYGSEYEVKIECPECGESYDNAFSLNGLTIKRLSAEPIVPNSNFFSFRLPLSGIEVQFRLLTGADDFLISQEADKKKKLGGQIDNIVTRRLFHSVVSMGGESDRGKLARLTQNMRAGDSLALRRYIDSIEPGVIMKQESVCKHCGVSSEVDVQLSATFFWPDLGS